MFICVSVIVLHKRARNENGKKGKRGSIQSGKNDEKRQGKKICKESGTGRIKGEECGKAGVYLWGEKG